ncbi:hypothetical protein WG908_08820 [Sphingobium sp. AN641]|uniref:hypothetical protein n=1 Tax=Sphingobium sp. AN641 TaxID=3133443 RepID=UPI0030BB2FCB
MSAMLLRVLPSGVAAMMMAGLAGAAQAPLPAALQRVEPGAWELRQREDGSIRRLCLVDPQQLLQLQHPGAICRRYTAINTAESIAVSYDCGGAGGGRTDVRIETARLVQIRSEGVAGGAPFSLAMEGRRVGTCR